MTILVTGAAGFSGARIMARLVEAGENPRGLVRDLARARGRLPVQGLALYEGDTTRPDTLTAPLSGVDTIIHTAFVTADRKQRPGETYYQTNVVGTRNLVAAAQVAGVKRIIVLTGLGSRPDTPGSYMQGRYEAEQSVRESGLAWSLLGPSVQFGKRSAFFSGLASLIRSVPIVTPMVGNGKVRFQPIWVEDVVTCLLKMAHEPERYDGRAIEVGGPEYFTYAEILDLLMAKVGKRRIKAPGPLPLAALGAGLMEAILPHPPITSAAITLFKFQNTTEIDAVAKNFDFQPRSLRSWLTEEPLD